MKKKSIIILEAMLLLASCGNNSGSGGDKVKPTDEDLSRFDEVVTYDNVIKTSSGEVPDPFVYRYNGKYYLYPTTSGRGVRCFVSDDMINYSPVSNGVNANGYCYEYSSDGSSAPKDSIPYAPEVIYYNGMFYMITSPSGNGHYILSSESPEGPFTAITGNIGCSIDGSFFISEDEDIYMFTAGSGALQAYKLEDDFTCLASDDNGTQLQYALGNCSVGGWTEGPYLLDRYGKYYLTYTGDHFLSKNYRVDYAYGENIAKPYSSSTYQRKNTILLDTSDDFYGLGHSCTVLAPDMDSYYLAYHNMKSGSRFLNFSRLSFDQSNMVANFTRNNDCILTDTPPFYSDGYDNYTLVDDKYLSSTNSEKSFTCEFNVTGTGRMLFSYKDEKNYSYLKFENNIISLNTVTKGKGKELYKVQLNKEYSTDVNHCFRLQYRDDRVVVYFDNIMKMDVSDIKLEKGKIGLFKDEFEEVGYSAYSNVTLGSSDSKYYADSISLASNYDEDLSYLKGSTVEEITSKSPFSDKGAHYLTLANKDDFATYRMYAHTDGKYDISMKVSPDSLSSSFGIRIDGGEVLPVSLNSEKGKDEKGDVLLNVASVDLASGTHNITIVDTGDDLSFSEICYDNHHVTDEVSYDLSKQSDVSSLIQREDSTNAVKINSDGVHFTSDIGYGSLLTKEKYQDCTVEASIKIDEITNDGYVGIIVNGDNYCIDYNNPRNPNLMNGYSFKINGSSSSVDYLDFNYTDTRKAGKFRYEQGKTYHLKVVSNNNTFKFYIDDQEIISYVSNAGLLSGQVGIVSRRSSCTLLNLSIK